MAQFKVQRVVDAAVIYEADVEASSSEEASQMASENEDKYEWSTGDTVEYDARRFVTLGVDGKELEHTARGDW